MSRDIVAEVREAVAAVPAGSVASYGDIAERIGTSPRQVGRAMGLLDEGVPWWRIVPADGTPATCHEGQAPRLLAAEGTPMRGTRVDMRRARHRGEPPVPPSP
ncbi:MGMT family protein [Streptomyces albogriseolus]|uniref:MGMT family protein n=1 Tax=Streptomyces albogriseolus TaxID=1887 RepID=UPI0022519583|nr:MGMT family protein [Streptomyces viridodiastaticus]MCX4624328.1 MGMT family protein [Streptomyces viridodiastaticus]